MSSSGESVESKARRLAKANRYYRRTGRYARNNRVRNFTRDRQAAALKSLKKLQDQPISMIATYFSYPLRTAWFTILLAISEMLAQRQMIGQAFGITQQEYEVLMARTVFTPIWEKIIRRNQDLVTAILPEKVDDVINLIPAEELGYSLWETCSNHLASSGVERTIFNAPKAVAQVDPVPAVQDPQPPQHAPQPSQQNQKQNQPQNQASASASYRVGGAGGSSSYRLGTLSEGPLEEGPTIPEIVTPDQGADTEDCEPVKLALHAIVPRYGKYGIILPKQSAFHLEIVKHATGCQGHDGDDDED